jgi:hypothetical protein
MQKIDPSNILFNLASDLVKHTSKDIFLTGRAGTGKTTFLKYIKEGCPKQMVVVAPTGVAAINAGGVTIHSFFQLPFAPFIPEAAGFRKIDEEISNRHTLLGRLRLTAERRKIMQELELLVIDEISMVRCDVLDAIDLVLRHVRFRHSQRFGGVQVLFIGDMYQLPPVVKEAEWKLLSEYYNSPYFFDSHSMKENPPVHIEFTKIYRQTEKKFIDLLNRVRNNELDDEHLLSLNERYRPNFFSAREDGYILLTTHNEKARQINAEELSKLPGEMYSYKAEVKDDFPASAFPADELLQLKIGTQVMFIKNDTDKTKRYFNGKIGVVTELEEDKILVQCKDETDLIEVVKETWENIHYTLDKSTRQLDEKVLGSFNQYPLRLAWAITIHKSQGLTFEKAVIDAGKAFAPGQVYVALSRCTNLEGMILHSKINPGALFADDRIVQFTKSILPVEELQQKLVAEKKVYEQRLLSSLFDFRKQVNGWKEIHAYLLQHASSFNSNVFPWTDDLLSRFAALETTAEKFRAQLGKLFLLTGRAEENVQLQERLRTAANWFSREIKSVVELISQSPAITDSTIHAKEYNDFLREVYIQSAMQNFMMQGFGGIFTIENFYRGRKSFVAPSFGVNAYAGASEKKVELSHPALYYQLKKLRDDICSKKNLPIYFVASSKTLEEMTTYLPQTLEELEEISGFGKSKVETYGNDFLAIIRDYSVENNLTSNISEKTKKPKRKETKKSKRDTKLETFYLHQNGKTIIEIATERNLTVQTIEGHLAYYVQNGLVKVDELVSREKIVLIESELQNFGGGGIAPIKEKLGNNASWGEIRLVFAWVEYQRSSSHVNH